MRRATKTGNKNQRPPAHVGRALKVWMLAEFGDGITVPCSFGCGRMLFYSEITKDRFPLPGRKGGRYVKGNVRPACMSCNARHGAQEAALERAMEAAKREVRNARRRLIYGLRKKGTVIFMADTFEASGGTAWATATPEQIIADIKKVMDTMRAERAQRQVDLANVVFEYTPSLGLSQAYFMKRELFDDGRDRVFIHPSFEPAVEAWRATLDGVSETDQ